VLIIYHPVKGDAGTAKLARSALSYLIPGDDRKVYDDLLVELTGLMTKRFGSFLVVEIESGGLDGFVISGPKKRLGPEFKSLAGKLADVPFPHRSEEAEVWTIRTEEEAPPRRGLAEDGAVWVRIKVPPVYRGPGGGIYPIYLRHFREYFAAALQRFTFDFLRLQTPAGMTTFDSLGKRSLSERSLEIDHHLARIAEEYRFLLLVAPTNLEEIEEGFFSSGFEKVPPYRYRLLPVDPDLLKRELFNLKIEDVDDPALSFLFSEKREEIDQELTMLGERGSRNFFFSSVRRYRGVNPEVRRTAEEILTRVPNVDDGPADGGIGALEFAGLAEEEFAFFQEQCPDFVSQIHIRDDVNVLMVSQGELFIPENQRLNRRQVRALTQHEVGTHVLTYFNGSRQPLRLLAEGLADYDSLQEGLAVMAEYFSDALSPGRLRTLAGRVVAGECLLEGADFQETFRCLQRTWEIPDREAFSITARMFQGGGFLKDIIYLEGLVHLRSHLMDGGPFEDLLSGKFGLKHIPLVAELTGRGILIPPLLKPRYMRGNDFAGKLQAIRDGLPIHQLIIS